MAFGSFENRGGNHTMSEINMVPLIDVMLVLLVIFIITAPLLTHSIKIDLPHVSAQASQEQPRTVDLAVDARGGLFWNDQPVTMERLADKFAQEAMLERSEEHTSELQSLMRTSYAVFCLKKKKTP